jgi:hypothetical protein
MLARAVKSSDDASSVVRAWKPFLTFARGRDRFARQRTQSMSQRIREEQFGIDPNQLDEQFGIDLNQVGLDHRGARCRYGLRTASRYARIVAMKQAVRGVSLSGDSLKGSARQGLGRIVDGQVSWEQCVCSLPGRSHGGCAETAGVIVGLHMMMLGPESKGPSVGSPT